jgi:hypothetical protein
VREPAGVINPLDASAGRCGFSFPWRSAEAGSVTKREHVMPTPDYTSSPFPRLGDLAKVTPFSARWAFAQSQRPHMERCIEQLKAASWLPEVVKLGHSIGKHWDRQQLYVLFNVEESAYESFGDIQSFYKVAIQHRKVLREVDDYERGAWLEINLLDRLSFVFSATPPSESNLRIAQSPSRLLPSRHEEDELHSNSKMRIGEFQLEITSQVVIAMKRLRPDRTLPPVQTFELFLTEVDRWLSECDAPTANAAIPVWIDDHFSDLQGDLLRAIWGKAKVPFSTIKREVYKTLDSTDRSVRGLVEKINKKLVEIADTVGAEHWIAQVEKTKLTHQIRRKVKPPS